MAAFKAAGALITTLFLLAPATAAADPAASGDFTPGANPNQVVLNLQLNDGGPVRFGAFDLPVTVVGGTPTQAPAGTSCGKDSAAPKRLRCSFGSGGWQKSTRVTLTVDTDAPVETTAEIVWRLSEDGVTDFTQPVLRSRTKAGNLTVEIYRSVAYSRLRNRLRVRDHVIISNAGPDESTGGTYSYTFPDRARLRRAKSPPAAPAEFPGQVVNGAFGPIPAGGAVHAGTFSYRIPISLGYVFVAQATVTGQNDPVKPDTTQAADRVVVPGSRFATDLVEDLKASEQFRLTGEANPDLAGQVMQIGGLPPRYDPEQANELRKVQVAIRKKARTSGNRCRWLRKSGEGFKRKKCKRGVWLKADGLEDWTLDLTDGLPAGRYIAYTRAVNRLGVRDTTFSGAEGDRLAFRVE
jgi:hypothetical protein